MDVPVYVDRTTGHEAPFSSAKLVLCLANPYDQAVPGTRAPTGLRLVDTKLTLSAGMVTNPTLAGSFVWRAVVTPWTANGAAENAPATVEAQSIVNVPSSLSLKAKVQTTPAPDDGHELRAAERHAARGSAGRRRRQDHVLRERQDRRLWIDRARAAPSRSKSNLTQHDDAQGDGDRADARDRVREPAAVDGGTGGCVTATIAGYKIGSSTVTVTTEDAVTRWPSSASAPAAGPTKDC